MKVEKTRKLYKKRKHNKEIKRSRQPWNQQESTSDIDVQESNEEVEEIKESITSQSSNEIPSDVIQFFNNPQTLLEFKQFQEYLKIKDSIRTRSNSETNDIPSLSSSKNNLEKLPITPPTTPIITKSKPLPSDIELLSSIDEEEELSDSFDDQKLTSKRNNSSF